MVELARDRVATQYPNPSCRVSWLQLSEPPFPFEDDSVDVACAFSVFTHIEHEDTYRYLKDALRIVRPGGRFIFSCLPMTLAYARPFFLAAAAQNFRDRWSSTRNITTSVDFMEAVATLAGWTPVRWYAGDQYNVRLPEYRRVRVSRPVHLRAGRAPAELTGGPTRSTSRWRETCPRRPLASRAAA